MTLRPDMYGPPAAPYHFRFEREQAEEFLRTLQESFRSWADRGK